MTIIKNKKPINFSNGQTIPTGTTLYAHSWLYAGCWAVSQFPQSDWWTDFILCENEFEIVEGELIVPERL